MSWINELLQRPIEETLYTLTVIFGWVSTTAVLVSGFLKVWQNHRQGQFVHTIKNVLLSISVPGNTEQTPKAIESLFANLSGCYSNFNWKEKWVIGKVQPTFSFEIVSIEGYTQFLVHTQTKFRDLIEAAIYAHYPEAEISEVEDYAHIAPHHFPDDQYDAWGMEITLKNDEYLPIRTYVDFEDKIAGEYKDPLGQILEMLAKMRPGEHFWFQMLVQARDNDWKKAGLKYIDKSYGVPEKHSKSAVSAAIEAALWLPNEVAKQAFDIGMLPDEHAAEQDPWKAFKLTPVQKEQAEGVLDKMGKTGHATKLRIVYLARKEAYNKGGRAAMIKGLLSLYAHQNLNAFGPHPASIPKDDYFWQKWSYAAKQSRLVNAYAKRSWGIGATPKVLNTEELATLWHFPAIGVKAPLVQKAEARRGEPPTGLPLGLDSTDDLVPPPPLATASMKGHPPSGGQVDHAPSAKSMSEGPDVSLPPMDHKVHVHDEEEQEAGLDADDIPGPPADVDLPGPPTMHLPKSAPVIVSDEADDEAPPNLPV